MLRLASDENFNGDIVRGLMLRLPELDLVRIQDAGLFGATDPNVFDWAAASDRILLTHDRATLPAFAYERMVAGKAMPGAFIINDRFPVGRAIEELVLISACSEPSDWANKVLYLPL